MDYRFLGASGFKVSALGFGAGTFGGKGAFFNAWGDTDVAQARRLIDLCLDAGVNFFDTADVYSDGASETILGAALAGRRDRIVLSTKITLRAGDGSERRRRVPTSSGSRSRPRAAAARHRLHRSAPAASLRRADAGRVRDVDARRPGARGQGAVRRRLELLRLAADEVAGGRGPLRLREVRRAPGLLLADRPRLRMGAHAARPRPGHRRSRVESARLGPTHGPRAPRPARRRRGVSRKRRSSLRPSRMRGSIA